MDILSPSLQLHSLVQETKGMVSGCLHCGLAPWGNMCDKIWGKKIPGLLPSSEPGTDTNASPNADDTVPEPSALHNTRVYYCTVRFCFPRGRPIVCGCEHMLTIFALPSKLQRYARALHCSLERDKSQEGGTIVLSYLCF